MAPGSSFRRGRDPEIGASATGWRLERELPPGIGGSLEDGRVSLGMGRRLEWASGLKSGWWSPLRAGTGTASGVLSSFLSPWSPRCSVVLRELFVKTLVSIVAYGKVFTSGCISIPPWGQGEKQSLVAVPTIEVRMAPC